MNINNLSSYSSQKTVTPINRSNQSFGNVLAVKSKDPFEYIQIETLLGKANPQLKSVFVDSKDGSTLSVFASGDDATWLNRYTVKLAKAIKYVKEAFAYSNTDISSMVEATGNLRKDFFDKNIDKYVSLEKVIDSNDVLNAIENNKFNFNTLEIAA